MPVFAGELTVDMFVVVDDSHSDTLNSREPFTRRTLSGDAWTEYLQQAAGDFKTEIHAGGSVANVSAAFVANYETSRARFVAVEEAVPGVARSPLWWRGFNMAAADLTERLIQVTGPYKAAPIVPETPGALIYLSPSGIVREIVANAQQSSKRVVGPQGDLLSVRTDHLRLLDKRYTSSFSQVALLLADDTTGWDDIPISVGKAEMIWIFGKASHIREFIRNSSFADRPGVHLIGTNGADPCIFFWDGEFSEIPVPNVQRAGTDLGAGDAYMGGFMGAVTQGAQLEAAHVAGCGASARALSSRGARDQIVTDLNKRFPDIDRSSPSKDEGRIFHTVRTSPGVVVVTGGQTGVDSAAAETALHAGLPVHLIFPKAFRQEDGNLTSARRERLSGARFHELQSASFRYRTWASVYMADVVLLLDRAGGEGSRETAIAAEYLNRPLWNLETAGTDARSVVDWLDAANARVVMIAGSRASLMAANDKNHGLEEVISEIVKGISLRNARLAGPAQITESVEIAGESRLGISETVLAWWEKSGLELVNRVGKVVSLASRDVATALERKGVDLAITWPSLISPDLLGRCAVYSLGVFPVHYGFVCGRSRSNSVIRVGVQYNEAFSRHADNFTHHGTDVFQITGLAEAWVASDMADMAYDSYRTGQTMAGRGLREFFPTHWETLAMIVPLKDV